MSDLPAHAQMDDRGWVAMKHYQPGQVLIQSMPSGHEYVAHTRANICLTFVCPEDVPAVLAKQGGCCNKKRQLFDFANEADVRRWTNGGGQ